MSLRDWITAASRLSASDLHVEAETPLVARVRGELVKIGEPVSAEQVVQAGKDLLREQRWSEFLARWLFLELLWKARRRRAARRCTILRC